MYLVNMPDDYYSGTRIGPWVLLDKSKALEFVPVLMEEVYTNSPYLCKGSPTGLSAGSAFARAAQFRRERTQV